MFKIQRWTNENVVVFALSGQIESAGLAELQKLLKGEARSHIRALDLKDVDLVDRDAVSFLAGCETKGIKLVNCPEREVSPK